MGNPTVLAVDDNPALLHCLVRMLENLGARVLSTTDPREALQLSALESVELLVADFHMPHMTGAELVRRARRLRPDLRAAILTGCPDDARRALGAEPVPVLEKPWTGAALDALLAPPDRAAA